MLRIVSTAVVEGRRVANDRWLCRRGRTPTKNQGEQPVSLAITYRCAGDPSEILEVTDVGEPPPPGPRQLQVRVTAFPIHPGDLLAISAAPPTGNALSAGIEATGVVTEVGAGVGGFTPATRVTFFPHDGAWRQLVNVEAAIAVPVPDVVSDEVAAQMLCNPITALLLRRAAQQHFSVGFDGVVLNNAAASSVGRLFTAVAEEHQIATISIVRSEQRAQQLRARFPTVPVVSTSDRGWADKARTAAAGRRIPVALDPVGGAGAADLLSVLSAGGTLIIYGELAQDPIPLHASTVLHSERAIRGLTINRWLEAVSPEQRASDAATAVMIATEMPQHFDVAATYPLDRIADAVRHVSQPGKVGTVVVKP
jgi:NADPH:quinone reductase-like Zn-dependent oxidoreductase